MIGATVQRVDVGPEVALLRVRAPGETGFLIAASGRRGGVGIARDKPWKGAGLPGGTVADGEKMRWRGRIEGARVVAIGARWIALVKGEARFVVEAGAADGSRVVLREIEETLDAAHDDDSLRAEGDRLARELGEGAVLARRQALARALAKAKARVARRVEAVRGDLARIGEADDLAARAALFVAEVARAPRGATKLTVTDWSSGDPREVTLALDPARSAREQVDALFKRARRLKLGRAIAEKRLGEAERAAARLDDAAARLGEEASVAEMEAIAAEARAAAPRDFALADAGKGGEGGAKAAAKVERSRPYRTFAGSGGARIFVGKGAANNDALTFHTARPHDLWLHAKGRTGAHVIVPLDKGHACPSELLVDAAHLAAHFSEAREEAIVEVQHTPRRHLRKPKGSAPGFVVVDREKVLVLRVERERLARLLAGEES